MHLGGLDERKEEAWELFLEHCGSTVNRVERKQLIETLPDKDLFPTVNPRKYKLQEMGHHHFFELLGWNPQAIILTALLWKENPNLTLVNLYKMIVE